MPNSIYQRTLLLISLCIETKTTILRLPCGTTADFNIFKIDKRLTGQLIRTDHGLDDVECMRKCVAHPKCRSYNINLKDSRCELNSKAQADNGTVLVAELDWLYKSTDYENPLVGITCRKLNPCKPGVLCQDTCEPPNYKCVTCDENHTGLHCDRKIDRNECESNPCYNSGTCIDMIAEYKCKLGFTGKNCETDIDECASMPCFNGGVCTDKLNGFQCLCPSEYTGENCMRVSCDILPCTDGTICTKLADISICLANVAWGKIANQSSIGYGGVPSRAVDGIKTGGYWEGSCTHSGGADKEWWEVDLGAVYTVYSVNITNRSDCCSNRLGNFNVTVDDTLCSYFPGRANKGDTQIPCTAAVSGRTVKVQLNAKGALTLCEVEVYAIP